MIVISGSVLTQLDPALIERAESIVPRLAAADPTIWGEAAREEASIRLGWLDLPTTSRALLGPLAELAQSLSHLDRVVLCGMGGSSLAPEVIAAEGNQSLIVLDSTDPQEVKRATSELERTLVVIASKSGSTIETDSQRRHFTAAFDAAGLDPREHMVVVTDPDSPLDHQARADGYRVINADPQVGGRFSALTAFGLTPTALIGLDPAALLDQALEVHEQLRGPNSPAVLLAVAMAHHAARSPLMTLASSAPHLAGLGDWIEQLVAESTGKSGLGVLPVVVESPQASDFLGQEVLSVCLGHHAQADLNIEASLGAHFLLWEWATAIAGFLLGIDPFNQPNVTESKTNTSALLEKWGQTPAIPEPDGRDGAIEIFGAADLRDAFSALGGAGYLAVMAYLDREADREIAAIRAALAEHFRGVTFGWGPRFLHSTGQFHKGGPQTGSFLQITGANEVNLPIPGRDFGFATLQMAQALGDHHALKTRHRPVVRLHLTDRPTGIAQLLSVAFSL